MADDLQALPAKHGPSTVATDKYSLLDGGGSVSKSDRRKETQGLGNDGYCMHNGREGKDLRREESDLNSHARQGRSSYGHMFPLEKEESASRQINTEQIFEARQEVDKHELSSKKDDSLFKIVKSGSSSHRKQLDNVAYGKCQENGISSMHVEDNRETLSCRKTKMSPHCEGFPGKHDEYATANEHTRKKNLASSKRVDLEEGVDSSKSCQNALLPPPYVKPKNNAMPPPYVKSKDSRHRSSRKTEQTGSDCNGHSMEPLPCNTDPEVNGLNLIQRKPDNLGDEEQIVGFGRVQTRGHQNGNELYYQEPRSARRKQHKSSSVAHVDDAGAPKRSSSSRRRDNSRKGLQILYDDEHSRKDDEEKMMDKLLLHYSKKPSTYDVRKLRKAYQANQLNQASNGNHTGESSHEKRTGEYHLSPDNVPATIRSVSLPREEPFSAEPRKVYTRANSFQPDGQAKHVHPNLPDYDDLAARFAALKGR